MDRVTEAKDADAEGIKICIEQIAELKELKGVRGIHIMGTDVEGKIGQIVKEAGLLPRPKVE
jgi:methylenetetrahydrofolate reductase (NADPH)